MRGDKMELDEEKEAEDKGPVDEGVGEEELGEEELEKEVAGDKGLDHERPEGEKEIGDKGVYE